MKFTCVDKIHMQDTNSMQNAWKRAVHKGITLVLHVCICLVWKLYGCKYSTRLLHMFSIQHD